MRPRHTEAHRTAHIGWLNNFAEDYIIVGDTPSDSETVNKQIIFNSKTGATSTFVGWPVAAGYIYRDTFYFSSSADNCIYTADTAGTDNGQAISYKYIGADTPIGGAGESLTVVRKMRINTYGVGFEYSAPDMLANGSLTLPTLSDNVVLSDGSLWDSGTWGSSTWDTGLTGFSSPLGWHYVGSSGYFFAPALYTIGYSTRSPNGALLSVDIQFTRGQAGL